MVKKVERHFSLSYMKIYQMINLFLTVVCLYLAIYDFNLKYPFWILSVNYTLFIFYSRNNIIEFTPGIIVLNIIMLLRYTVQPIVLYLTGELSVYANNYDYISIGLLIMVFEQVAIFIALDLSGRKISHKRNPEEIGDFKIVDIVYGKFISVICLLLLFVLGITNRSLVGGLTLLTKGYVAPEVVESSSAVALLWQVCTTWLFVYYCLVLKKQNVDRDQERLWPTLLLSLLYILITVIGQTRISRWYTIVSFVAVFAMLIKLYPNRLRTLLLIICVPVVCGVFVLTIFKNTDYLYQSESHSMLESLMDIFDASFFEPYLAGPTNVNNSYGLYKLGHLSLKSLFYDVVNNMPIANHFFDTINATVNQYNMYIGRWWGNGGDQIIPLVGQSLIYFTPFFAPLLSVLSVLCVRYFDYKYVTSQTVFIYIYAFISIWVAFATILNLTIILSWIYVRIIPLFIFTRGIELLGICCDKLKESDKK